jgi:hypothetical protein
MENASTKKLIVLWRIELELRWLLQSFYCCSFSLTLKSVCSRTATRWALLIKADLKWVNEFVI